MKVVFCHLRLPARAGCLAMAVIMAEIVQNGSKITYSWVIYNQPFFHLLLREDTRFWR